MGIIDTLSAGFARVARRLWLVAVPILVDIGIWVGPRLSINKLSQQALAAIPDMSEMGTQYQQSMDLLKNWLSALGADTNILSMVSMRALGLPSLTDSLVPKAYLLGTQPRLIEVQGWPQLLALGALLSLGSLLLGSFCLSLMAQEAREEPPDLRYALRLTVRSWLRLSLLALLILMGVAILTSGVTLMAGMLVLLSPQLASLTVNVFVLMALWCSVYFSIAFFFAPRAMVLDDTGILRSLWSSFNVVRRNFVSAVGFILLINIIQIGLLYVWRVLARNSAGTLIGIVGNAYVGAGLLMASFIFYRDRFVAWQEATAQAKAREGTK